MIQKKYRLNEKNVKKVLQKGKPFFSYNIVLNYTKNKLDYNRFAIVIGSKSVHSNVERNFFRRRFYDEVFGLCSIDNLDSKGFDLVFVLKKKFKLDKTDLENIKTFKKDIDFLLKKIIK